MPMRVLNQFATMFEKDCDPSRDISDGWGWSKVEGRELSVARRTRGAMSSLLVISE